MNHKILNCYWLSERARGRYPRGSTALSRKKIVFYSLLTKVVRSMAGYWHRSFIRVYGPRLRLGR